MLRSGFAALCQAVFVGLLALCWPSTTLKAAAPNYALDFSEFFNSGGYLEVPNPAGVVQAQGMTFSAWIWPYLVIPDPGPRTILSRGDGGGNSEYIFQIGNGASGDLALFVGGWYRTQGGVVPDRQWSHVAVTWDGREHRFYLNGNLITTIPHVGSAFTQSGTPLYIGRQGSTCNCNLMSATMDEIQIWDRALTQTEIQVGMFTRFTGTEQGLVAYFGFNDYVNTSTPTTTGVGSRAGTATLRGVGTANLAWTSLAAPQQPALVNVGAPIAPPPQAINPADNRVYRQPTVTSLAGTSVNLAYFWGQKEQRLYLLQPVGVLISWATSSSQTDFNAVQQAVQGQWPANPQIAVVSAPVDLQPANSSYFFQQIHYSEPNNSFSDYDLDPQTKRFVMKQPGYATLRYLVGGTDPGAFPSYVQVVRAVSWSDPSFLQSGVAATVGTKVTDPRGITTAKSGFVVFTNTPVDSVGSDAAYSRASQTGSIIPVNVPLAGVESNLVVAFYAQHPATGVLWPDKPVSFNVSWPGTADSIDIVNTSGVSVSAYPGHKIYNQPDPAFPGYNPNEEHAFLDGDQLFALRNDMNRPSTSQPFVLLKYVASGQNTWSIKMFKVVLGSATFGYADGEVGKVLRVPHQMDFVDRSGSCATVPSGPVFADAQKGDLWGAYGPIPEDPAAEVVWNFRYSPRRADFFTPNPDNLQSRINDTRASCTTWSGVLPGTTTPTPIDVTYRIHWPPNDQAPLLQVGETLLNSKHGLPSIFSMETVDVVFDSLNPRNNQPLSAVARLYDPFTTRNLSLTNVISGGARLPANYTFPTDVKLTGVGDVQTFVDLPYYLRARLSFNKFTKQIGFGCLTNLAGSGEPLLLNNVMTAQERDRILQLSSDTKFRDIIQALYDFTRNPNGVDLNGDGQPEKQLLTGFKMSGTSVVRDPPPQNSRALSAGQSLPTYNAFGLGAQFVGDGVVTVSKATALIQPNAFTFEAWVRPDALACNTILSRGGGNNATSLSDYVWTIGCGNTRVALMAAGGWDSSTSDIPLGAWTHVAVTFDGVVKRFYINGRLDATVARPGPLTPLPDDDPLFLGRQGSACQCNGFQGGLDDVRIWNRVRTPVEIQASYAAPLSGLEEGLTGYWRFDDASSVQNGFRDGGTGFRDGTISGSVSVVSSGAGLVPLAPGGAVQFTGQNGYVKLPDSLFPYPVSGNGAQPFTFEVWFQTSEPGAILGQQAGLPYQPPNGWIPALYVGTDGRLWAKMFFGLPSVAGTDVVNDGKPHHAAVTYDGNVMVVWLDGRSVAISTGQQIAYASTYQYQLGTAHGSGYPSAPDGWFNFKGTLDEVRVWNTARTGGEIATLMRTPLSGAETGLIGYWRFEDPSGTTVAADTSPFRRTATFQQQVQRVASPVSLVGSPVGTEGPRYLVLAENNRITSSNPVDLKIIRVGTGPFKGELKVIFPDNVFDERLTIRHSSDFGGDPSGLEFEWYYHPDQGTGVRTNLPVVGLNGVVTDLRGWTLFPVANPNGATTITLGEGSAPRALSLSDNWIICRYRGYSIGGQTPWSPWVGGPGAGGDAQLAPGWIKRVTDAINPFEQVTTNFHTTAVNTYANMLTQAGKRYEGDIALNNDPANLNSVGLIETYATVLNRARKLTVDGSPPISNDPAIGNSMLLAASRISELYMLLGNEAFADASDPTIGFDVSGQYGTLAPSIFAFQNQMDSLLEEEVSLLRGRDPSGETVTTPPVYNRLYWNFTKDKGEVAYALVYDVGTGGLTRAKDLYPQGHGDAWGHYLTAVTTYYDLLRHPRFLWKPRPEYTLIDNVPVQVDYLDERKFAKAAAARARTGAQVVDLTYRLNYVEDPAGQFQGYKDTDPDRAWGVSQWARRAAQGAFFDWVTANAILPATDPDPSHTGIQKIDRTTVSELDEIIGQHEEVQAQIEKADSGLNPLGLAAGTVPFDIDPVGVSSGRTHYEQISARALSALNNALALFNYANQLSQSLRRNQDTQQQLATNTNDKERDYKNRLIEIFGYPYSGDIGPGATYPSGYDGPDIYHHQYINASELTGEPGVPQTNITAYYRGITLNNSATPLDSTRTFDTDIPDPSVVTLPPGETFQVTYPISTGDYGLIAPTSWAGRRAPGKLQNNLSDMLRAEAKLKQAVIKYDLLLQQIQDTADILDAQYNLNSSKIIIRTTEFTALTTLTAVQLAAKAASINMKRFASVLDKQAKAAVEALPKSVGTSSDVFAPVRSAMQVGAHLLTGSIETAADNLDFTEFALDKNKDTVKNSTALALEVENQKYEVVQKVKALEQLVRSEAQSRFELYDLKEAVAQAAANYRTTLAQGLRLMEERAAFRRTTASTTQQARYNDMAFRIFQNDALQKYRAQLDLAARYVYLAAKAYDFDTCRLGSDTRAGQGFLTEIVRSRTLGQIVNGLPQHNSVGLTDPLARMDQNFATLKSQLGFLTPETETGRFSLRTELLRVKSGTNATDVADWRQKLAARRVDNLWAIPEFRKYCVPFDTDSTRLQPALVIEFATTVTSGLNYFGKDLGGGDSYYDSSRFATKIKTAGVWFSGYDGSGLPTTPRVYLFPAGADIMRTPGGDREIRAFTVIDQKLPVPFPIGNASNLGAAWIPNDTLGGGDFGGIRQFSQFRAYPDSGGFSQTEAAVDTRLVGRSVWNSRWILIIPGASLGADKNLGLDRFINFVTDIKIFFQTYAYSGN